ncbi:MAG TPA: PIN domain-containing protein, partial [Reyranella sp.]|nr:PIN domain-containing protein [Reyranella sp.]
ARPKFSFEPQQIATLPAMLRAKGELFQPQGSQTSSPDPDDAKFLHCAEGAAAEFIVTGNKRDFPGAPFGLTHVVNAGELLDRITAAL